MSSIQRSQHGWLFLCSVCEIHIATVCLDKTYYCETCFDYVQVAEQLTKEVICECGAEKANTTHTEWCPKYG